MTAPGRPPGVGRTSDRDALMKWGGLADAVRGLVDAMEGQRVADAAMNYALKEAVDAGLSIREIGRILGVTHPTILYRLKKMEAVDA